MFMLPTFLNRLPGGDEKGKREETGRVRGKDPISN